MNSPHSGPSLEGAKDLAAASQILTATDAPIFHKEKHISYWLRCLRSPLPTQYTSNDSNRMTLAFFTVSALDLLGVLHTRTTTEEREENARWIYRCQHPDGGFRAFPGTDFGAKRNSHNKVWDPANLPATYFALASLAVLGDDLRRVNRASCLRWLSQLQRPDGSFGQTLGFDGFIEGGMDTRFGYCAMGVRWFLRGDLPGDVEGVPDVDADALVRCIRGSETYDGGISEAPFHEAHAGFTYCAIGALAFIGRSAAPAVERQGLLPSSDPKRHGLSNPEATVRWLMSRLTTTIEEEASLEDADLGEESTSEHFTIDGTSTPTTTITTTTESLQTPTSSFSSNPEQIATTDCTPQRSFEHLRRDAVQRLSSSKDMFYPSSITSPAALVAAPGTEATVQWGGFNGRINKLADTCYAFWVGGSLSILHSHHLIVPAPVRRYLLGKTQHLVMGGFGKCSGDLPDIFHSYLGLAALSLLGLEDAESVPGEGRRNSDITVKEGLRKRKYKHELGEAPAPDDEDERGGLDDDNERVLRVLDPTLCMSVRARRWVEGLQWRDQG